MKEAWGKFYSPPLLGKPRLQGHKKAVLSSHAERTKLNAITLSPSKHPNRDKRLRPKGV